MNDLKIVKTKKNVGLGFREITPRLESNCVPYFDLESLCFLLEGIKFVTPRPRTKTENWVFWRERERERERGESVREIEREESARERETRKQWKRNQTFLKNYEVKVYHAIVMAPTHRPIQNFSKQRSN